MPWRKYSKRLKEVLRLRGSPIAITYSMKPVLNARKGRYRVCDLLFMVRDGVIINLNKGSSACPGATCHMAIAYPLVSGEMNVSLMDYTTRRIKGYRPEDLLVTIAYHKLTGIIESIDCCTAGTAKMEFPPEFRRLTKGLEV